jgi:diguanylate cyclase (GGDEF)-like protein/PAS domain S-box-containing protein
VSTPVHILSLFSVVVTAIYLYLGMYILRSNPRERLNRVFFFSCLCLAFWSFGYTFLPGAADKEAVWFWYKVSAVGWTIGPALLLHLTTLLGRPELLKERRWVLPAIYLPAVYFLFVAWTGTIGVVDFVSTRFGWSDVYGPATLSFIAYLIFFPLYIGLGLGLVVAKGRGSDLIAVKKQSRLIAGTGIPLLVLTGVSGILLPWLEIRVPPEISHLIVPVWILAVWQALSMYSPMTLTPAAAGRDVLKTVADAVILVNRDHKVVGGNPAAEELFGLDEAHLHGRSISDLVREKDPTAGSAVNDLLLDEDTENLELIFRGEAGEQVPVSLAASSVVDAFGQAAGAVLIVRDMTERQLAEESLKFVATHDALTGLPNRSILTDRLRQALKRAKREKKPFALLMFDLDEFKQLNDFYGHKVGDRVLQEVASILSRCVRGNDTVCRLGSDEFLIVVENLFESGDSDIVAERISSSLRRQLKVGEHTISVTGSIGISTFPFDGLDPETLMKKAHLALYSSKEKGRGVYQFYSPSMNTKNQERMAIENRLREAARRARSPDSRHFVDGSRRRWAWSAPAPLSPSPKDRASSSRSVSGW